MSFNINGPSNKPVIQEAQNMMNNGGGGNLGYFMRENSDEAIKFVDSEEEDCFEKSVEIDEFEDKGSLPLFDRIIRFLKRLWRLFIIKLARSEKTSRDEFVSLNK